MTTSSSLNKNSSRSFASQNRAIHEFVIDAVDAVLSRVQAEPGQDSEPGHSEDELRHQFYSLLEPLVDRYKLDANVLADEFAHHVLGEVVDLAQYDFARYPEQDPALSNLEEIFYASNGFWATIAYRIAHALRNMHVPIIPRAISGFAHSRTGVDIHPGAQIGPGLFIDHGTGIAIGCTAVLHENVSLYNGVVLGTKSKPKKHTDGDTGVVEKRHPTIEAGVSLYTSAFVGGDVTIGQNAIVGAYAFVTHNVPAGTAVKGKVDPDQESNKDMLRDFNRIKSVPKSIGPKSSSPARRRKDTPWCFVVDWKHACRCDLQSSRQFAH